VAGRTISVTSSVANVGGAAASSANVAIMLSTNPVITSHDLELGRFTVTLDPNRATTNHSDVTIPVETASGTSWIGPLADPMGLNDELTESNSGRAADRSIVVNGRGFAIATAELPIANTGLPYAARVIATGGSAPLGIAWHVTSGALPAGLMLIASSGEILGL